MDEKACHASQDGFPTTSTSQDAACEHDLEKPDLERFEFEKDTEMKDGRKGQAAMIKSETDLHADESVSSGRTSPTIINGEVDVEAATVRASTEKAEAKAAKVRRSERRGLLGQLTVLAEVENPKEYSRATKWFITFIVAAAAVAGIYETLWM